MDEPKPRVDKGCLLIMGVFAVGALAGVVALVLNDKGSLAFFLGFFAVAVIVAAKPWKPETVEGQRAHASDMEMIRTLEALGIPLDFGTTTPEDALLGGLTKVAIVRGVKALDERRYHDATTSLGSAITNLSAQPARWQKVLAVAHRLRGKAHEGAGRPPEALADYDRALALAPDDAESQAGKKRLTPPS
jgi:hypothetical protein